MSKYYAIDYTVSVKDAQNADVLKQALHLDEELIVVEIKKGKEKEALAAISKIATNNRPATEDQQHPIFEVEFTGNKGRKKSSHRLANGETIDAYTVTPNNTNNFTVLSAAMEHVDAKYKSVDLTAKSKELVDEDAEEEIEVEVEADADAEKKDEVSAEDNKEEAKQEETKKADEKKAVNNSYITAASIVAGTGVVAAGFWFSGLYPVAIDLLAKVGLALPAATLGVQIGVSLAVGAAVVGLASLAYYGFNKLFATTAKTDTRTADQKYHDELKATEDNVKSLSDKLTAKEDKDFLAQLNTILDVDHTAERKFKKDGDLMKNQPAANDKLIVLNYEAKKLAEVVAAEGKDRAAIEAKALEAAKTDAAKKFAI
ncbi:MAG: hypothetical protein AB7I18_07850 [Candidatus Berkiella sp.]